MNFCACMGPMGSDPHCPCKMKELGLPCSNAWTPEKIAELDAALAKYSNEEVVLELMSTVSTMLDDLLVPLNVAKYAPLNLTEEKLFEAMAPKEPSELDKFQAIARGLREPKKIRIIDYISVLQPLNEPKISEELYQEYREIMSNHRINLK